MRYLSWTSMIRFRDSATLGFFHSNECELLPQGLPSDRAQTMLWVALYKFQWSCLAPGKFIRKVSFGNLGAYTIYLEEKCQASWLPLTVSRYGVRMSWGQLWHHIHQRHIEEDPRCGWEEPRGDLREGGGDQEAKDHANHGQDGGEDVVEYGLLDCHPGLDEHGKVSDLMGKLMAEDRHTGG